MFSDIDVSKEFDKWEVKISGWEPDLVHLANYFDKTPYRVFKDAKRDEYIFESDAFSGVTEFGKIRDIAEKELRRLSGALKISRNSPQPLQIDYVFKCNAEGDRYAFIALKDSVNIHEMTDEFEITQLDSRGNSSPIVAHPPRCIAIANLASKDPSVEQLMRYVTADDHKTWVGMYRTYEVIENAEGSEKKVASNSPVDAKELNRFKGSCNSYNAGGELSRHTFEKGRGMSNFMTMDEAYAFLWYLVQTWLGRKGV